MLIPANAAGNKSAFPSEVCRNDLELAAVSMSRS